MHQMGKELNHNKEDAKSIKYKLRLTKKNLTISTKRKQAIARDTMSDLKFFHHFTED